MNVSDYKPRRAWDNPLYQAVAENLATFLAGRQLRGRPVPFFVVRDFQAFLDCGVPAHGLLHVRCEECGRDRVVPLKKILACLGMLIRAPPTAPARIEEWGDGADAIPINSDAYA